MPVLPNKVAERLAWFEQRVDEWQAKAPQIGLSEPQVVQLQGLITAARDSYDAAQAARNASRAATVQQREDYDALSDYGADLIKTIRAYAETLDDPSVYALAQIPPPATPVPAGPPVPPQAVEGWVDNDGAVQLKWQASVAAGTFFTIWRKLPGQASFAQVGSVRAKKFTDATVPQGIVNVSYVIRAQRGTQVSEGSETLTIPFGAVPANEAA